MTATDGTAQYLLSRLRTTRKAIRDSAPDASCKAHGPMADGVACLLECKEIEIEAAQQADAKAEADKVFRERVKYAVATLVSAIAGAGIIKVIS